MYELSRNDYAKALPLLDGIEHSRSFVFSVLESNHVGRVYADNPDRPPRSLLMWTACGMHFLAGEARDSAFSRQLREWVLAELVPTTDHVFLIGLNDPWRETLADLFRDCGSTSIARKVFELDRKRFRQHQDWRERVPEGFAVQRYDRTLAEGVKGAEEFWGSMDRFFSHGLGFAVTREDKVVSRCHSLLCGNGVMEISIETEGPYRRRGFATLASCAFIEQCLENGVVPVWSCWFNHTASMELARKLGFVAAPDVQVTYLKGGK